MPEQELFPSRFYCKHAEDVSRGVLITNGGYGASPSWLQSPGIRCEATFTGRGPVRRGCVLTWRRPGVVT